MSLAGSANGPAEGPLRSWRPYLLLLGLYLSARGYHSFDGDQAYRLPLLLHRQDAGLYADDPFVRALDDFNPHRGSLALLDVVSRPLGLPAGLFAVFAATFLATTRAVNRLARATWPEAGPAVGWVAVGLFLSAKAGNIGTNHLFEAMVLDRLAALSLGWLAIAEAVTSPSTGWWRAPIAIVVAAMIHPSVGLQLALALGASWLAWGLAGRISGVGWATAWRGAAAMALAVAPGLAVHLPQRSSLQGGLPDPLYWILSVELQNPQHMLPHLWRMPQWLAWFGYVALAALGARSSVSRASERRPGSRSARNRLAILLAVLLLGLGAAWAAIEVGHDIRATVFQPFRMSTVVRGIALVLIAERVLRLWRAGGVLDRVRASVLAAGFLGDWLLVAATVGELSASAVEVLRHGAGRRLVPRGALPVVYLVAIASGLNFLAHHDTEYGHVPLLVALVVGLVSCFEPIQVGQALPTVAGVGRRLHRPATVGNAHPTNAYRIKLLGMFTTRLGRSGGMPTSSRACSAAYPPCPCPRGHATRGSLAAIAVGLGWIVPCAAMLAAMIPPQHPASRLAIVRGLVARCRFYPMPLDDIERLALWCREHTPESARFIGPPGPKTFRLWSRRSLAFNRSGSPYHGDGLLDWFARFRDHVGYRGTPEQFVRAYRDHRHEFEARYDSLTDAGRAELAVRQGADYLIAGAPKGGAGVRSLGPLELLHVEGRYAAYRVNPAAVVHRQP